MNSNCGSDYTSLLEHNSGEIDKSAFHNLIDQINNSSGDSQTSPYFNRNEILTNQEKEDLSSIREQPSEGLACRSQVNGAVSFQNESS